MSKNISNNTNNVNNVDNNVNIVDNNVNNVDTNSPISKNVLGLSPEKRKTFFAEQQPKTEAMIQSLTERKAIKLKEVDLNDPKVMNILAEYYKSINDTEQMIKYYMMVQSLYLLLNQLFFALPFHKFLILSMLMLYRAFTSHF